MKALSTESAHKDFQRHVFAFILGREKNEQVEGTQELRYEMWKGTCRPVSSLIVERYEGEIPFVKGDMLARLPLQLVLIKSKQSAFPSSD